MILTSSFLSSIWMNWTFPNESVDGCQYSTLSTLLVSMWLIWWLIWSNRFFQPDIVTSTQTLNKFYFPPLYRYIVDVCFLCTCFSLGHLIVRQVLTHFFILISVLLQSMHHPSQNLPYKFPPVLHKFSFHHLTLSLSLSLFF